MSVDGGGEFNAREGLPRGRRGELRTSATGERLRCRGGGGEREEKRGRRGSIGKAVRRRNLVATDVGSRSVPCSLVSWHACREE